ncbi:DUF6734 family protein [uncultured Clostridium sp.]|uniref:DUF6734 family protein n=2 Tax=uncultured Clostridium sp. TaxID=59620 RepID=UPI00261EC4EF|nr:DUF6734 family protein [uncultured Clostridium sp.]
MIEAFHSNWTRPFLNSNPHKEYYIDDFEILTTIISALKWREKNGNIKMITDEVGASYYKSIGLDIIWNLGIDIALDDISDKVNSNIFWAAGKLYALKEQKSPCVMIDTDFIVWESIEDILINSEVSVIHKENIIEAVYPNKEYFRFKNGYSLDENFDWTVLPSNTAFAYISNDNFKDYYVKSAIDFMNNLDCNDDKITNMVFAEQRLISMCAKRKNIEINEIMSLDNLFSNNQNLFTHTWGHKREMRNDFNKRKDFCIRCIIRIIKDYPEYESLISNIEVLKEYYDEVKKYYCV